MPYTNRNKLEKIETNTQINTWGETQSRSLDRVDESLDGVLSFTLSGDKSLKYENGADDEAHYAIFNITGGTGGRIIFQPVQGVYLIRNGSSGTVDCTIDGVQMARLEPGTITQVFCDGVNNLYQIGMAGVSLTKAIADAEARARVYADQLVGVGQTPGLPGQAGAPGRVIKTNGTSAFWDFIAVEDIEGLQEQINASRNFAIAIAAIL